MTRSILTTRAPGTRPLQRWLLALPAMLIAGVVAAALPSAASAQGITLLTPEGPAGPGTGLVYGGFAHVHNATNAPSTTVTISREATTNTLRSHNPRGNTRPSGGGFCSQVTSTVVSCPRTYPAGHPNSGQIVREFRVQLTRGAVGVDPVQTGLRFGQVRAGNGGVDVRIGPNSASGASGNYVITGGSGNDRVNLGNHGTNNIVTGGAGNDVIQTFKNGRRDVVACGSGNDLAVVDLQDNVSGCETVLRAPIDQHPIVRVQGKRAKVKGGRAPIRLSCPKQATSKCQGQLRILRGKKGNKALGKSRYNVRKGNKRTVRVKVRSARGLVRVTTREPGSEVGPKTGSTQIRLR